VSTPSLDSAQQFGRYLAKAFIEQASRLQHHDATRTAAGHQLSELLDRLKAILEAAAQSLGGGGNGTGGAHAGGMPPKASPTGPDATGSTGGNGPSGLLNSFKLLLETIDAMFNDRHGQGPKASEAARSVADNFAPRSDLLHDDPSSRSPALPAAQPRPQGGVPPKESVVPQAPAQTPTQTPAQPPASKPASEDDVSSKAPTKAGSIPPATGEVQVDNTIVVKAGTTFDGGGKLYKAGPSLGDGGRSEGQKPVFILEDGAKLKNVQISGADGVHCYGDATVQNVWWKDVGEDALTKKAAGDVRVIGGGANDAHDKVFIATAGGSLSIEGFSATNFGRLVATDHRFVPERKDGTFPLEVTISNSKLTNGDEVFRTDAANAKVTFKDVELNNVNYDARGPAGMLVIGGQKVGRVEGAVV
jgi:Pectate lyase